MPSGTEYHREHKRGQRAMERGEIDSLITKRYDVEFGTKDITPAKFKRIFTGKIANDEQRALLNTCLDLLELIKASKDCLQREGAYTSNVTGSLKVNPAQKELRENLKAFNAQMELLIEKTTEKKKTDIEGWLNE